MDTLWSALSLLALVGSVVGTAHLLLHYRRPATAMSWLFALWALPLIGAVLYLMFAVYQGPRRIRRRRRLSKSLRERRRGSRATEADDDADVYERIAESVAALPTAPGNAVEIHPDGHAAADAYLDLIASAEHEVFLLTFIWDADDFSERVALALGERLRAGCDVRVVVDAIGSRQSRARNFESLRREGVPLAIFLEPNPFKGRFQINFRNHRKMLVVDGCAAIVGGRNVTRNYYGDGDAFRDLSLTIRGSACEALRSLFLEDWIVASEEADHEPEQCEAAEEVGDVPVRVIPHGIDETRDSYLPLLCAALRSAREDITVVTPYFIPGESLHHELRMAALRGVRVRVLMPARSPERWPEVGARRFLSPLLDVGVEIWRRSPPFIHAKAVLIDDAIAYVGSANFDQRSLYLNYELTCELRSAHVVQELRAYFESDFEASTRLDADEFEKRGWWPRVQENFVALFAPLL